MPFTKGKQPSKQKASKISNSSSYLWGQTLLLRAFGVGFLWILLGKTCSYIKWVRGSLQTLKNLGLSLSVWGSNTQAEIGLDVHLARNQKCLFCKLLFYVAMAKEKENMNQFFSSILKKVEVWCLSSWFDHLWNLRDYNKTKMSTIWLQDCAHYTDFVCLNTINWLALIW